MKVGAGRLSAIAASLDRHVVEAHVPGAVFTLDALVRRAAALVARVTRLRPSCICKISRKLLIAAPPRRRSRGAGPKNATWATG
jgi:hypothetical protein